MKNAILFCLMIVLAGCTKLEPEPFPALATACKAHQLHYRIWCYAARGCYGSIFPADKEFQNTSFITTVQEDTREAVADKLIKAAAEPLKPASFGGEEVYSHDGGAQ